MFIIPHFFKKITIHFLVPVIDFKNFQKKFKIVLDKQYYMSYSIIRRQDIV